MNELRITADGSHTIYVPEMDEHYHSVFGAIQESSFIFIQTGFDYCTADPVNIFEVGFGTGLNALLTAIKCMNGEREINYTCIEKYPVQEEIVKLLNYPVYSGEVSKSIFDSLHNSPWNEMVNICRNFNIRKIKGDMTIDTITGKYDLIYFDAFAPEKQPEMWTLDLFEKIASFTNQGGLLVTYSAKGEVKRILQACGFAVSRLPGPPGKRQIIRAIKN